MMTHPIGTPACTFTTRVSEFGIEPAASACRAPQLASTPLRLARRRPRPLTQRVSQGRLRFAMRAAATPAARLGLARTRAPAAVPRAIILASRRRLASSRRRRTMAPAVAETSSDALLLPSISTPFTPDDLAHLVRASDLAAGSDGLTQPHPKSGCPRRPLRRGGRRDLPDGPGRHPRGDPRRASRRRRRPRGRRVPQPRTLPRLCRRRGRRLPPPSSTRGYVASSSPSSTPSPAFAARPSERSATRRSSFMSSTTRRSEGERGRRTRTNAWRRAARVIARCSTDAPPDDRSGCSSTR